MLVKQSHGQKPSPKEREKFQLTSQLGKADPKAFCGQRGQRAFDSAQTGGWAIAGIASSPVSANPTFVNHAHNVDCGACVVE